MKVLVVSLFHPELVRGGAQLIAHELFRGLQATPGVQAVLLASTDRSLPALYKTGACITGFDGRPDEYLFLTGAFDPWWHKLADPRLVEAFADFLRTIRPDVVHFHHFMTFGVELLTLTRRMLPDCRIVFTFHEFLAICTAGGHMVRRTDGALCDHASPVRCHQCFPDVAPEQFFLRTQYMQAHLRVVDAFTAPGRFMRDLFVRWGLPADKFVHVANGQRNLNAGAPPTPPAGPANRFGFFGQLVDAKGVALLLAAVEHLRSDGFDDFAVEINGDNLRYGSDQLRDTIERFAAAEQQLPPARRRVTFNGSYHPEGLAQRMARIDWCVVPSVWWESFALVISEAWMFGKPVIAANVGGPAERITPDRDGLLFDFADSRSLARTMRRAASEQGLCERLSGGIRTPSRREAMTADFLAVYRRSDA